MKPVYAIALVGYEDMFYDGSNLTTEEIGYHHFSGVYNIFGFDTIKECELVIKNMDIRNPVTIVKVWMQQ
jgi:hypothetical protein